MNEKLERLKSHVAFLSSLLGKESPTVENSFVSLVEAKFALMKALRQKSQQSLNEIVTNKNAGAFPSLPAFSEIKMNYSQQELTLTLDPAQNFFHPVGGKVYFTNSGQTAVNSAWLFLVDVLKEFSVITPSPLYHEAAAFLRLLAPKTTSGKRKVLCLDSTSYEIVASKLEEQLKHCDWVVVDSTCWEMRSPEMETVILEIRKRNVPAFIVRSHVKLDALGAEYGLLGSIVYLPGDVAEADEHHRKMKHLIAITRSAASFESLYPFWTKDFLRLTQERTADIRANTRFVVNYLRENLKGIGKLVTFPHELYCFLELEERSELEATLRKSQKLTPVPFLVCDSFGFDQFSITMVGVVNDPSKCGLRFAGSDLPREELKATLDIVCRSLKAAYQ
jgi:hypothetical protein